MIRNKLQRAFMMLPKVGMLLLFIGLASKAQSQQCNCGGPNTTVNLWTDDFGTGSRTPSPNANLCYEDGTGATNCGASWAVDDGDYTVHNTTAGVVPWPAWSITNDHTGGGLGRMMIVNAGNQGQTFYTIQVPVQAGCNIDVSFWVKNVINVGVSNHLLPDITLRLLDTLGGIISSVNTGPVPQNEQWYQYSLSVNPGTNSAVQISLINNLPPGNGNDFVLDDISMDQTYNIGPTCDFTFQTACNGLTNFTSTASSFATSYAWDFDNDGVTDDTNLNPTFTYPSPGSYLATLTVTDGLCSYSQSYTVTIPIPANAGTNSTAVLCGNAGATPLFNLLNGTPDLGGTWTDPNGTPIPNGILTPSTSQSGLYTYSVPGIAPCTSDSATLTIGITPPPNAGNNAIIDICSNAPAFQLLDSLGGLPDPNGMWTDPNGNAHSGTFNTAFDIAGTYTYTVSGGAPCSNATSTLTIGISAPPNAGGNVVFNVCASFTPFLLFDSLGGTPDPGGTWTDPNGAPFSGNFNPALNTSGIYTYLVNSTSSCPAASATVDVNLFTIPNSGTNATSSVCASSGPVGLLGELGGTPTPGGSWLGPNGVHNGIFDPSIDSPGNYEYTVLGVGPCANQSSLVQVTITPAPDAGTAGVIDLCSTNTSTALFGSLGGTPDPNGTWTNPNGNVHNGFFDASLDPAGVYTYVVQGIPPCLSDSSSVTVNIIAAADAGTDSTIALCVIGSNVALLNQLGGTPDIGGVWTGPNGTHSGSFNPSVDSAGVYTYSLTGIAPCTGASSNLTISVIDVPNAGTAGNISLCSNDTVINLFGQLGGTPDIGGSWTDPNNTPFSGILDPALALSGIYNYTVSGMASCPDVNATVSVSIDAESDAGVDSTLAICFNSSPANLFVLLGPQAGTNGQWTDVRDSIFSGIFNPIVDVPGIYTYVLAGNGVCLNDTAKVTVAVSNDSVVAGFTTSAEIIASTDPSISFINTSQQATDYLWDFGGFGSSSTANPTYALSNILGSSLNVCLSAWNPFGCSDSICEQIVLVDAHDVWIPNAFTPEGTGINETFGPVFYGDWVTDYQFNIFNRWGELIFVSANPAIQWDGTHKGNIAPDGVYAWRLMFRNLRSNWKEEKLGHVILIR